MRNILASVSKVVTLNLSLLVLCGFYILVWEGGCWLSSPFEDREQS